MRNWPANVSGLGAECVYVAWGAVILGHVMTYDLSPGSFTSPVISYSLDTGISYDHDKHKFLEWFTTSMSA